MVENGVMIICGLSMEMELAEEMGTVGKCVGCWYLEYKDYCRKKDVYLNERKENCKDWCVDIR